MMQGVAYPVRKAVFPFLMGSADAVAVVVDDNCSDTITNPVIRRLVGSWTPLCASPVARTAIISTAKPLCR